MTPFVKAKYVHDEEKIRLLVNKTLELYPHITREKARYDVTMELTKDVFINDKYQVAVDYLDDSLTHLSIKRIDREPIHDWRDLQQIKNEICGAEFEGVELYPRESRKVDTANQYHLWVITQKKFTFPFGFMDRLVLDSDEANEIDVKQRKLCE